MPGFQRCYLIENKLRSVYGDISMQFMIVNIEIDHAQTFTSFWLLLSQQNFCTVPSLHAIAMCTMTVWHA